MIEYMVLSMLSSVTIFTGETSFLWIIPVMLFGFGTLFTFSQYTDVGRGLQTVMMVGLILSITIMLTTTIISNAPDLLPGITVIGSEEIPSNDDRSENKGPVEHSILTDKDHATLRQIIDDIPYEDVLNEKIGTPFYVNGVRMVSELNDDGKIILVIMEPELFDGRRTIIIPKETNEQEFTNIYENENFEIYTEQPVEKP